MELIYLFNTLLKKKWIVISCTFIAILAAFFLTRNSVDLYKSSSQIATGFTAPEQLKLTNENFSLPQVDIKFNNVIENFTSPKVLQLVSYDLILHDLTDKTPFKQLSPEDRKKDDYVGVNIPGAIKIFSEKLAKMETLDADNPKERSLVDFLALYGYDVETLADNLTVERLVKTDYINIDFLSHNPNLSAYVSNMLVSEFNRYYKQTKRVNNDVSLSNLDSSVNSKKRILDEKLTAKSSYQSNKGVVDVNIESGSKLSQISGFETDLAESKSKLKDLNYRIAQWTSLINDAKSSGKNIISDSKVGDNSINDEYINARKEYNDLNNQYILKGSSDVAMKKKLDDLSRKMRSLNVENQQANSSNVTAGAVVSVDELIQKKIDAEGEVRATTEKISLLQERLSSLNSNLNGMATTGADLQKLNTEIGIASSEYSAAKDKLNAVANVSENYSGFKQTVFGQPALLPEPSKRLAIIALAGIAALFLSSMFIALLAYLDQSLKTPSHFSHLTQLPLIGTINYINKLQGNILQTVNNTEKDEKNRHNTFRELLRKLRYEIEISNKRVLLFTSTEPQQGKTTLIQALSYSLSLSKKRILIIDTNFCNNDLTTAFSANPVLEKFYVNGRPFQAEDIKKLVTKTGVDSVDMIGCGSGDYTPSEILPKNHLLNYLGELLTIYDYIFLEGAPLNSYTDTKELIHYSDGMIAVFSSEASLTAVDKESIEFLFSHKDKFIGAILNKIQPENLDM